jgi:hypothetical protein
MFVRWQKRKLLRPVFGRGQDVHWSAILVESRRVDGKPRPCHVVYLGGITDSAIEIDAQRCHFWDRISARLDALGNRITPADRNKIEAVIADKVSRPTPAQYKDIIVIKQWC